MQRFSSPVSRGFVLCLPSVFLAGSIHGQTPELEVKLTQIEQMFSEVAGPGSPGVAVAITKNGATLYMGGFGTANLEHDIPITEHSVFDLASLAKPFTGMAVAMLVEQDRLDTKEDIRSYLPRVPDFGTRITVDHLIHHTSGLRDWVALLTIAGRTESDVITGRHIWSLIESQEELNFAPGSKFLYSNTNYFLLAELVSRVTGTPFGTWVEENILLPLEMHETHIVEDHTSMVRNRAAPYDETEAGIYANFTSNLSSVGSSSMYSSVSDLTKWMINQETGAVGGEQVLARTRETAKLNDGQDGSYAYGLNLRSLRGRPYVSHGGWWQGYRSKFMYFPEEKLATVVLANCVDISPDNLATRTAMVMLDIEEALPERVEEPPTPTRVELDPAVFDKYVGKYSCPSGCSAFTVSREGDEYFMQCTDFPLNTAIAVAENKFYTVPEREYLRFDTDAAGVVNQLVVEYPDGGEAAFTRADFVPLAEQLEEICGTYYCPELQTDYELHLVNDTLVASHFHNEDVVLSQELTDMFMGDKWWFKQIVFRRDHDNHVTGFRLTADQLRLKELRFKKRRD